MRVVMQVRVTPTFWKIPLIWKTKNVLKVYNVAAGDNVILSDKEGLTAMRLDFSSSCEHHRRGWGNNRYQTVTASCNGVII